MLSVLKNRNFALLLTAMLISEFGTGITSIASSILVFRETGSAASVGLMLMATALPGLLFGLLAGVFVDRVNRKHTVIAVELLSGLLILLIPVMLQFGIIWLYILVALKSTIYQLFNPALNSILPEIASENELAAANSLISASHMAAMGLGFAAAGFIASTTSVELAFIMDAVTFVLAGGCVALIAVPAIPLEKNTSIASLATNLRDGMRFLGQSPALISVVMLTLPMGIIFGLWNSAMLPFALTELNLTEFEYSAIEGLGLIGFVLGSLIMGMIGDRLREGQWLVISFIGMGMMGVCFALSNSLTLVIIFNALLLLFNVPSFVARSLIIQRNTTRNVRGRVSSVYFVMRDFSFVIGMALVSIVDLFPIRIVLVILAVLLIVMGILAVFLPGLRRSTSEWRHSISLLRGISEAPGLTTGRSITMSDLERLGEVNFAFNELDMSTKQKLLPAVTYAEADEGTVIIRQNEINDNCYVVLKGQAVAGQVDAEGEKVLEVLSEGDFFGEIAALTGQPRTADVIAREETHLLRIPSKTLRQLTNDANMNRLIYSTMTVRLVRMGMIDNPYSNRIDQDAARETRSIPPLAAQT